jgi:multidrug efflux pump
MLAATFIAIFLIPVLFYVVEKLTHRNGEGKHQPPSADEVSTSQPAGTPKH